MPVNNSNPYLPPSGSNRGGSGQTTGVYTPPPNSFGVGGTRGLLGMPDTTFQRDPGRDPNRPVVPGGPASVADTSPFGQWGDWWKQFQGYQDQYKSNPFFSMFGGGGGMGGGGYGGYGGGGYGGGGYGGGYDQPYGGGGGMWGGGGGGMDPMMMMLFSQLFKGQGGGGSGGGSLDTGVSTNRDPTRILPSSGGNGGRGSGGSGGGNYL